MVRECGPLLGRVFTAVPAAGSGIRMGLGYSKAFVNIDGIPLLGRTLSALLASPFIDRLTAAVRSDEVDLCEREVVARTGLLDKVSIVKGGEKKTYKPTGLYISPKSPLFEGFPRNNP